MLGAMPRLQVGPAFKPRWTDLLRWGLLTVSHQIKASVHKSLSCLSHPDGWSGCQDTRARPREPRSSFQTLRHSAAPPRQKIGEGLVGFCCNWRVLPSVGEVRSSQHLTIHHEGLESYAPPPSHLVANQTAVPSSFDVCTFWTDEHTSVTLLLRGLTQPPSPHT